MKVQKVMTRNPRAELYYDIVELFTGVCLVGFLWTHMIFDATILLGTDMYNTISSWLDKYYLSYVGIPFIILVGFMHVVSASRRIPTRYQEQKIIWRHAKMIKGTDTWVWVFQVITGMSILVLAAIHIFVVLTNWPIEATISSQRISSFWWFYLLLLIFSQYHACFGIYRQFVKWGWFPRKPVGYITKFITLIILSLGLVALWVFSTMGGAL